MHDQRALLRYDGKYSDIPGAPRQWTVRNHWIDGQGADRHRGSFSLEGLKQIGIVPDTVAADTDRK